MQDELPAAAVADAVVRLRLGVRAAPSTLTRLGSGLPILGPAVPCRHAGSADIFLEAIEGSAPGGVLVIDNQGRLDEGCLGDLAASEARAAGFVGIVIDGLHRDSVELARIGSPIWSRGSTPFGPLGIRDAPTAVVGEATIGDVTVTPGDVVVADDDGVIFVEASEWEPIAEIAREIVRVEAAQRELIESGTTLRQQLRFADYLARRATDPTLTFRQFLREIGGAIET